jgi:death-on-curing protein
VWFRPGSQSSFNDGNKRAGFLAIGLFLALNGHELKADPVDAIQIILQLAAGELSELKLAGWIREGMVRQR